MRVAVLNAVLANGGDAAIALGLLRALRAALGDALEAAVYDSLPDVTAPLYPELEVSPSPLRLAWTPEARGLAARGRRAARWLASRRRLRRAADALGGGRTGAARRLAGEAGYGVLADLAGADLVVSTGGTYLVEHYWLGPRLLELDLVRRLRRPLVLFTQSLGPFRKRGVRRALRRLLPYARLVLVRDERSARHVRDVAPEARVAVAADAAFALADPGVLAEARARVLPEGRPLRVGVSVRDWPHFQTTTAEEGMRRYRASVAALVTHLVRARGAEVRFFSTCQGLPAYRFDDARVAAAIAGEMPDDVRRRVEVVTAYLRPERTMAEAARCDLVVATRMHAAILALCAGTPVLPIAYEFKTREVFGRLGVEAWVQEIEGVTPEGLVEAAEGVLAALPAARAGLFARVEAERADAMAAGARVVEALGGRP